MGSLLAVGNELSEETHVLTKQRLYWEGRGAQAEISRVREPREKCFPCGS